MTSLFKKISEIQIKPDDIDIPRGQLTAGPGGVLGNGLQLFFGLIGGIALIVIIIGGLKYILSQGNPQETAKAKDTILYAIVGLVVCILGFNIVGFVFRNI